MHQCFLLLGSNLGDKAMILETALDAISKRIGGLIQQSSIFQSEPWGFEAAEYFLNIVAELTTEKSPFEILEIIQDIEKVLGRVRGNCTGYKSRTIDIDMLFFDDEILASENLIIPHPKLHLRRFTLEPLLEIAPQYVHPLMGKTIAQLLADCQDKLLVKKLQNTIHES